MITRKKRGCTTTTTAAWGLNYEVSKAQILDKKGGQIKSFTAKSKSKS